jgi:hypothetical protein
MYKTTKDWVDFDSSKYLNAVNSWAFETDYKKKPFTPYEKKPFTPYEKKPFTPRIQTSRPKMQSKSFSWWRPNFSKQFEPLQEMINDKVHYLAPDSSEYLDNYNSKIIGWWRFPIDQSKFPIVRKYNSLLIEWLFYWYKSKWIIKDYIKPEPKEKVVNKNFEYKKKFKKVDQYQPKKVYKKIKSHKIGLNPTMPLWTMTGDN